VTSQFRGGLFWGFLCLGLFFLISRIHACENAPYSRYQAVSNKSFALLRGSNGLISDKIQISIQTSQTSKDEALQRSFHKLVLDTSPTNIAIDLWVQMNRLRSSDKQEREEASQTLSLILQALKKLEHPIDTKLFFNWYSTEDGQAINKDSISSVDNVHLALALWTLSRVDFDSNRAEQARALFEAMDFSPFYDPTSGLISGAMLFSNGRWVRSPWTYDYWGSEARTLYSAGWALHLFQKFSENRSFITKAAEVLKVESAHTTSGKILKTWDGGAFQLLLPRLLLSEERYSPAMATSFENYSHYIVDQAVLKKYALPAAHSACNHSVQEYIGHSGSPELVSNLNADLLDPVKRERWDEAVTPHAVFLAASLTPALFIQPLKAAEPLGELGSFSLFDTLFGWLDSYIVSGQDKGKAVPVVLALDQGIILLSLDSILSEDRMSLSARELWNDPTTRHRLQEFYSTLEPRLEK